MKKEQISQALGNIDAKYIQEAAEYKTASSDSASAAGRKTWLRWASVAAAFCLLVVGVVAVWQSGFFQQPAPQQPPQQVGDTRWPIKEVEQSDGDDQEVDALLPDWEDMTIAEQFRTVFYGETYYSHQRRHPSLPIERIGESLGPAVLHGSLLYDAQDKTANVTLYAVKDFSQECVIAVQFEGQEDYYAYINSDYCPETLGDFIADVNLRDIVSFGSVWYSYWLGDEYITVEFVNLEDSVVWEMLLTDTDVQNVYQDGWSGDHPTAMSISVDIPLLGYQNISLAVTEDGYLTTNILETGKAFFIGKDKVQAFMDYVIENCEGYQIVYVTPGEEEGEPETNMPIESEDEWKDAPEEQNWPEPTPVFATPVPSMGTSEPPDDVVECW